MAATYIRQWRSHGCIIRQRGPAFQVECSRNGRRVRETFRSEAAAVAHAKEVEKALKVEGVEALAIRGADRAAALALLKALPTPFDRADALDAVTLLREKDAAIDPNRPRPTPLAEAVRFWRLHHPHDAAMPTLAAALDTYLDRKKARRPTTLAEIRQKVGRFVGAVPADARVGDVTTAQVDRWLSERLETVGTRAKYKRVLHAFFAFCCRQYRLPANPVQAVYLDVGEVDQREVEVYTIDETRRIMAAATAAPEAASLVPALAIGFFAGLRPAEIAGLDWRDVSLDAGLIRVTPATAKKRRQRFVEIRPNLAAWLRPNVRRAGPVAPPANVFRRARAEVLRRAQVPRWLHDGLRHSFGTYHLAAFGDANATAAQMGHRGSVDLVFLHYRALVSQAEATPYWNVFPEIPADALGKTEDLA
jgi:integrase